MVPTWLISLHAKPAHLEPIVFEHTSTLKFIERLFNLPTLASVDHMCDTATPVGGNYETAPSGDKTGPPAPPRDTDPRLRPVRVLQFLSRVEVPDCGFGLVGAPSVVMVSTRRTKVGPLAYFLIRGLFRYFKRIPSTRRVAGTATHQLPGSPENMTANQL